MKFPGTKDLERDSAELLALLEAVGAIMVIPAFLGWTQFRPNTVGIINPWYGAYISSPLGLGTGPHRLGWLLMIILAASFVIVGAKILTSTAKSPVLRISGMTAILALYIGLWLAQAHQINHWISESTGGNCGFGQFRCVPTDQFTSSSGRVLTVADSSPGWGMGIATFAIIGGIVIIIWMSKYLDRKLR